MMLRQLAAGVAVLLWAGCCTFGNGCNAGTSAPDTPLAELKDGITSKTAPVGPPAADNYYIAVNIAQADTQPLPPDRCAGRDIRNFIRKSADSGTSAAVILAARVRPVGSFTSVTVPLFASTKTDPGAGGAKCNTVFADQPITFTYPATSFSAFDIEFTYYVSNDPSSTAAQHTLATAAQIAALYASAGSTPGSFAILPMMRMLEDDLYANLSAYWTSLDSLTSSVRLSSGANGQPRIDEADVETPALAASAGNGSVKLSLTYSGEFYKSNGQWLDVPHILAKPVVSLPAAGERTLDSLIRAGDTTSGLDYKSIQSATDVDSLRTACIHLKMYLAKFLVPDDALAARFAVLKGSPYELMRNLRADSACFWLDELATLIAMNSTFVFEDMPRARRDNSTLSR